jgi:hypothetical protein
MITHTPIHPTTNTHTHTSHTNLRVHLLVARRLHRVLRIAHAFRTSCVLGVRDRQPILENDLWCAFGRVCGCGVDGCMGWMDGWDGWMYGMDGWDGWVHVWVWVGRWQIAGSGQIGRETQSGD